MADLQVGGLSPTVTMGISTTGAMVFYFLFYLVSGLPLCAEQASAHWQRSEKVKITTYAHRQFQGLLLFSCPPILGLKETFFPLGNFSKKGEGVP